MKSKGPKGDKGNKGPAASCYFAGDWMLFDNCAYNTPLGIVSVWSNSPSPDPNQGDFIYDDSACTGCGSITGLAFMDAGGFYVDGSCEMITCSRSDRRLKKAITTLQNSLEKLLQINVNEYDWKEDSPSYEYLKEHGRIHDIGLIAQELMEFYPELVYEKDGYYGIIYQKLNAVLIEAVKEQNNMISIIGDKINLLKSKL